MIRLHSAYLPREVLSQIRWPQAVVAKGAAQLQQHFTVAPVKPAAPPDAAKRPSVNFAFLREQVTISQVLKHLGLLERMHCRGPQLRGPCPIHGQPKDSSRSFSIGVTKNIFRCFNASCEAQGNVLDLWAAIHKLPVYEAALHLAAAFGLSLNREEEPVKKNPWSREKATTDTASIITA